MEPDKSDGKPERGLDPKDPTSYDTVRVALGEVNSPGAVMLGCARCYDRGYTFGMYAGALLALAVLTISMLLFQERT